MKKIIVAVAVCATAVCAFFVTGMANPKSDKGVSLDSDYCYLVDYDSGRVLIDKNSGERRPIASMVKIMTLLLTFEQLDSGNIGYDDMATISHHSASQTGSEMFLDEGEQYSVSDLIKGVVTMSANDGAVALAEYVAGNEESFVKRMNDRAKELGMVDTLYCNPTGLPSDSEQYSTAKDVTMVMRQLLTHSKYHEYSTIWLEDYKHPSGRITQMANTNKLIRHYKGCDGGKTGYTDSAKYCLSASAMRDGMRVVGTVMGAADSKARFRTMSTMFNFAFNNYSRKVYLNKDKPLSIEVKIVGGKEKKLVPIIDKDLSVLTGRGDKDYQLKYDIPESVVAPLRKGDKIGSVSLMDGDNVLSSVDVLAPYDIAKADFWDIIKNITK